MSGGSVIFIWAMSAHGSFQDAIYIPATKIPMFPMALRCLHKNVAVRWREIAIVTLNSFDGLQALSQSKGVSPPCYIMVMSGSTPGIAGSFCRI